MSTEPQAPEQGSPAPLRVDVVSDVVCPWCFVGKRQLERALARWAESHPGEPEPVVAWHPFQLNPDMPAEGMDRAEYLQEKFGRSDSAEIYDRVKHAAAQVDLTLAIESISRQPNTLRAHALIAAGADAGLQDALAEAFFDAYFHDGRDLTDRETLAQIARGAGLDEERIAAALDDFEVQREVHAADVRARKLGISGVPFFVVDQRLGVSGAAGVDTLLAAFERARSERDTQAA